MPVLGEGRDALRPDESRADARTPSYERLEGEGEGAALRIIIEWPSKEAAEAFMDAPAYQPHLKARTAGSNSHHFLIEGKDDLA